MGPIWDVSCVVDSGIVRMVMKGFYLCGQSLDLGVTG